METRTDKHKRKNVLVSKADLQAPSRARSCPRDRSQPADSAACFVLEERHFPAQKGEGSGICNLFSPGVEAFKDMYNVRNYAIKHSVH